MKCPGQDSRYWKPGAIFETECPECGKPVEFFKDDTMRKCGNCGHRFVNPNMDFGCAAYCKFAKDCIGELPPELLAQRQELMKDRIAVEMKRYFGSDFKRIGHASRVARHAEAISGQEGGDPAVILAAAYLHDIGIHEAEKKHGSTAAKYQEQEGPPIARQIMEELGANEDLIGEVCGIIGRHHHPAQKESVNFKVLYDADLIANIEDGFKEKKMDSEHLKKIISKNFLTQSGKQRAEKLFLN
ncbi:MAG: HD domain-containing protein [Desulfobacteraceae bacterium]|nr:HD domain-containing protein [Desulfobacteraceae bacterium]MCF8095652.1 HD domain-containing protein [Desulfobacteraceae bacterium]